MHSRLPPVSLKNARQNVGAALADAHVRSELRQGSDLVLDVDASPSFCGRPIDRSPCLTRARGQGLWLLSRGRRLSLPETARLQGLRYNAARWPGSATSGRRLLKNSMSPCVIERILLPVLRSLGLDRGAMERWLVGSAQRDTQWNALMSPMQKVTGSHFVWAPARALDFAIPELRRDEHDLEDDRRASAADGCDAHDQQGHRGAGRAPSRLAGSGDRLLAPWVRDILLPSRSFRTSTAWRGASSLRRSLRPQCSSKGGGSATSSRCRHRTERTLGALLMFGPTAT